METPPISRGVSGRPADTGHLGMFDPRMRRGVLRLFGRSTLMLVLLTISYYLLPDRRPVDPENAARTGGVLLALVGVGFVVRAQVSGVRRGRWPLLARVEALLTTLYLLILLFASTYYMLDATTVGQFEGIADRTDSLYFAVTVVSTVGFGDIHAVGTAARLLVTGQMLFDLIFIGTAVRALGSTRSPDLSGLHDTG